MKIETYIDALVDYGMETGLLQPEDRYVAVNRILEALHRDDYAPSGEEKPKALEEILKGLLDYAVEAGLCEDNTTARDLFDTKLMGLLTPMPREVDRTFREKYGDRSFAWRGPKPLERNLELQERKKVRKKKEK